MSKSKSEGGGLLETVKTLVYALLIAGVFRSLFFQPFWIPSGSMKDTLLIGDFLFVNKMAYGYSKYSCEIPILRVSACPFKGRVLNSAPERGDVVVFRHPVNGSDFIKRLVGLPGDRIQMKRGVLHINDQPVGLMSVPDFVETYAPQGPVGSYPRCANGPVGEGGACTKIRMTETFPNGVSHSILNVVDGAYADNTQIFTVPPKHYFFIGDNRDNSQDSRYPQVAGGVGFVHEDLLIGRADRIMFSSAGRSLFFFWTWRSDRFFKAID